MKCQNRPEGDDGEVWEHKVVKIIWSEETTIEKELNVRGADGWELVAVDGGHAYFKRPSSEEDEGADWEDKEGY